ncbi:MAG: hypothetical protein ACJ8IK_30415 [Burkholderiaceae bacterium]|jgi:hypothetical protein
MDNEAVGPASAAPSFARAPCNSLQALDGRRFTSVEVVHAGCAANNPSIRDLVAAENDQEMTIA